MAIFKCKMCGAPLEVENENCKVATCEYCGTTQTVPTLDNEKKILLHNRANTFRLKNGFDKAMVTYENIVAEFVEDAEAYWGLVLSKYGIEYVDDPKTGKKIPTCHRTLTKSILNDDDYLNAIKYSDVIARALYEKEAKEIDRLQKEILVLSQKEEPYDIFICYKETDNLNKRTIDSVIAQDIYDELTKKGYKVFFARITLESKLGSQYEPIIYAALNSSKAMLVIGTKPEYFNAVWVKNEWSRFIDMINHSNNRKYLIPCYKDMDAYDLPEEMLRYQCQDLNKLGYMQDLIRGLDKIFDRKEKVVEVVKERIVETKTNVQYVNNGAYQNTAIREDFVRITMYLEMGNFIEARNLVNKLLAKEMTNARLWIFSLLAQLQIKSEDLLGNHTTILTNYNQYNKALEYADSDYKQFLIESNNKIVKRKEDIKKEQIYSKCLEYKYKHLYYIALSKFNEISDYKDSKNQIIECEELADNLYNEASNYLNSGKNFINYKSAIRSLGLIVDYKDSRTILNEIVRIAKEIKKQRIEKLLYNVSKIISYPAKYSSEWSKEYEYENVKRTLSSYNYKINIRYDLNGVKKPHPKKFKYQSDLEELYDICNFPIDNNGYSLNGWELTEFSVNYDIDDRIIINIYLGVVVEKEYTIIYDCSFGKEDYRKDKIISVTFTDPSNVELLIPNGVENRVFFCGWFDENGNEVKKITQKKDYKLIAKWQNYLFDKESNNKKIYFGYAPLVKAKNYYGGNIEHDKSKYYNGKEYMASYSNDFYELVPLLWDIVEQTGNVYKLVMSKVLKIDYLRFSLDSSTRIKKLRIIHPNNYEFSDIRAYINGWDASEYGGNNYFNGGLTKEWINHKQYSMINHIPIEQLQAKPMKLKGMRVYDKFYLLSAEDMSNPIINTINDEEYMLRSPYNTKNFSICSNGKVEEGALNVGYYIRLGTEITIKKEDI